MSLIAPQSEHHRPAHLGQPRRPLDGDGLLMLLGVLVMVATVVLVLVWSVSFPTTPIDATATPAGYTDASTTPSAVEASAVPPSATPAAVAPVIWPTSSTEYCEHTARTRSGTVARDGVVAVAPSNFARLRSSVWRIVDGPLAGKVVTVEDMGPSADFDVWVADCHAAHLYGRRFIHAQLVASIG